VFIRKDSPFRVSDRRVHPDDVLKRLARNNGRSRTGPTLYVHQKRPFDKFRAFFLLGVGLVLLLGGVTALPFVLPHNEIVIFGMERVTNVTPASLVTNEMYFSVKPVSALEKLKVRVDGRVGHVRREGERLRWVPESDQLGEGKHTVTLESGGRFLWRGPTRRKITVIVDSVAPTLDLRPSSNPVGLYQPFFVRGSVEDGATVKVNGVNVKVAKGEFAKKFDRPPIGLVRVEASDRAGNVTTSAVRSNVALPEIRGVHMSAISWLTPELKDPVMALADAGKINTIQLDLKDESGIVGYRSKLPKVVDLGANGPCEQNQCYDLKTAVDELHARGLRVVGRVVAFRDPLWTRAALNAGRLGDVVQQADGSPYQSAYGGFANPASPAVQQYILDVAREAADAGVDDILFDYIRRPEGSISKMRFAGLANSSHSEIDGAIVEFLRKSGERLSGTEARLGVSVFGIAAQDPDDIAQNVREMAKHVDYVAPMVYPSHWGPGYYDVNDPPRQPFDIVARSLKDFQDQVQGTDAIVVPWLQDFTLGSVKYGSKQVRAQIMASRSENANGFLLWDPKVTYTAAGIPGDAPPIPLARSGAPAATTGDRPSVAPTVAPNAVLGANN
jgi:hypothetical protein